jgi:predicted Zn-dependent peptidase
MEHVRSAAINFLVPAGAGFDPVGQFGLANVMTDLITRGAGDRDSRQLSLAMDGLGLDSDESVGAVNMRFWASTLARNIPAALDIYSDIILRPRLPEDELEPVQELAIQDILSLEDSPQGKVMVELRRQFYPPPLGRDKRGLIDDIERLTIENVRAQYRRLFRPNGSILSVAGNIEWSSLKDQVERLFGGWTKGAACELVMEPHTPHSTHLHKDTQQTQIALAFGSVPVGHPDYYAARAMASVLSGGMSSRLFNEVREKRGLCYTVQASHETMKDRAAMIAYAGTRAARAQETLDVTLAELRGVMNGVTDDEVVRVKAGLKASLVMLEESTSGRAGALATDWYYLGRVRDFTEIQAAIDALTPATIVDYATRYPVKDVTLVTLGPQPLVLNESRS